MFCQSSELTNFKFVELRLLVNAFGCQKVEGRHFYSCLIRKTLPKVLLNASQSERNYSFPTGSIFWKSFSLEKEMDEGKETIN